MPEEVTDQPQSVNKCLLLTEIQEILTDSDERMTATAGDLKLLKEEDSKCVPYYTCIVTL